MDSTPTAGPSGGSASSALDTEPSTSLLPPPAARMSAPPAASGAGSLRNASNGADDLPGPSDTAKTTNDDGKDASQSNGSAAQPAVPVKPVNRSASSKRAVVHSGVQRRNPVLGELQRLKQPTEMGDIPSDYQVGEHAGLLFLSLKYHRLHPEYIHTRIEQIKNRYKLRILMVLCDVNEHQQSIKELSRIAIYNDLTMMVAWSNDEVAQYIAQFKMYEHKSAATLKEKVHQQYKEQLQHVLTTGKRVNKTDANNLASQFGSFANIVRQQAKALSGVKGLGKTKVETLVDAFHKPFLVGGLKRKDDGGEVDTFTSSVSGHPSAAVPETGASGLSNGAARSLSSAGKGKARASGLGGAAGAIDNGSPEWPDEADIEDDEEAAREQDDEQEQGIMPRRGRAPSRSPGLSPELRPVDEADLDVGDGADGGAGGEEAAWRDPLEDEGEDGDEEQPASKRVRT